MRLIMPRLYKLRKEYDSLGYSSIINLDAQTGSPRSILSIAKAIARLDGSECVKENHIDYAVTQFAESREAVFEGWSEKGKDYTTTQVPVRKQVDRIGRIAAKILVYLVEHPNTSKAEIREAFPKVQERIFDLQFSQLHKTGLVYLSDQRDERYSSTYTNW